MKESNHISYLDALLCTDKCRYLNIIYRTTELFSGIHTKCLNVDLKLFIRLSLGREERACSSTRYHGRTLNIL